MKKKYNFIAAIGCYIMAIIYVIIGLKEDSLPYAIGFVFWIVAGVFQEQTYKNKRRIEQNKESEVSNEQNKF